MLGKDTSDFWGKFDDNNEECKSDTKLDKLPPNWESMLRTDPLFESLSLLLQMIKHGHLSDVDAYDVIRAMRDCTLLLQNYLDQQESPSSYAGEEPRFLDLDPLDGNDPSGVAPSIRVITRVRNLPKDFRFVFEELEQLFGELLLFDPRKARAGSKFEPDAEIPLHALGPSAARKWRQQKRRLSEREKHSALLAHRRYCRVPEAIRLAERSTAIPLYRMRETPDSRMPEQGRQSPLDFQAKLGKSLRGNFEGQRRKANHKRIHH